MRSVATFFFVVLAMLAAVAPAIAGDHDLDQKALFRVIGARYGLDPDLLEAIAKVESNGNSNAVSPAGAQGLMQLMPATAEDYGVRNSFDPVENALGAARFLVHLREWQATQPDFLIYLPQMLAAYNAGQGAVDKYKGVPPYQETKEYVRRVLRTYLLGNAKPSAGASAAAPPHPVIVARQKNDDRANERRLLDQLGDLKQQREQAERTSH